MQYTGSIVWTFTDQIRVRLIVTQPRARYWTCADLSGRYTANQRDMECRSVGASSYRPPRDPVSSLVIVFRQAQECTSETEFNVYFTSAVLHITTKI